MVEGSLVDFMETAFPLDLSKHCIETEIKRLHNRLIIKYLNLKQQDIGLETQIQALEDALKHMDFSMLRTRFSALSGNSDGQIELVADSDRHYRIFINGNMVHEVQI